MAVGVEIQSVQALPVAPEGDDRLLVVPTPKPANLTVVLVDDLEAVPLAGFRREVEPDLDVQVFVRRGGFAVGRLIEPIDAGDVPRCRIDRGGGRLLCNRTTDSRQQRYACQ